MVEARQTVSWTQTADIIEAIYNNNPYRARNVSASQFNPFARNVLREQAPSPQMSDEAAMRIFEHVWGLKPEQKPEAK